MRLIALVWLAAISIVAGCGGVSERPETTRELVFETPRGEKFDLLRSMSEMNAKVTLVVVWTVACPYCKIEFSRLSELYERYRDSGLHIVAVNAGDSAAAVRKYVEEYGLPFPVVLNGKGASDVVSRYGVLGYPANLFLDRSGSLVERLDGYEEVALLRSLRKFGIGESSSESD